MFLFKKFKDIVSKIIVGQNNKKKWLKLSYTKWNKLVLNVLWEEGLIYGYSDYVLKYHIIFFKYSNQCFNQLKRLVFFKNVLSSKKIGLLSRIEGNSFFFLLNDKGFISNLSATKKGVGGKLIAKV